MVAASTSTERAVALAEPTFDESLALDGEFAQECPRYVDTVRRALTLAAGEGFADVRAAALAPKRLAPPP